MVVGGKNVVDSCLVNFFVQKNFGGYYYLSVLSEFEINTLIYFCPHAFFTNLWWTELVLLIIVLFLFFVKALSLSPRKQRISVEMINLDIFELISTQIKQNFYNFQSKYNVLFFALFLCILFFNIFGLAPFFFTLTTHLFFVLFFSLFYFMALNFMGIVYQGLN
jgi:F-type H+-transporting ATPase subunit a